MAILRRRFEKDLSDARRAWGQSAPVDRLRVFRERADRIPAGAADLFLLGCARLRAGDVGGAARGFGAAYHADCALECAAMLTFACLKASAEAAPLDALAAHVATTWEEMRRPPLGTSRLERRLLDVVAGVRSRSAAEWSAEDILKGVLGERTSAAC